jgi:hypothetical protein
MEIAGPIPETIDLVQASKSARFFLPWGNNIMPINKFS